MSRAVKGSKQHHLKVVPHRPLRRLTLWLVALILVGGAVAGSYYVGEWRGASFEDRIVGERAQLEAELTEVRAENKRLRQKVANLSMAAEVDKQASEQVRGEVIELRQKIAGLEEDIAFYRGLMAPGEDDSGLTLGEVNLVETAVPRRYAFKVVVQQLATNHKLLNGSLNVDVVGRGEAGMTRLALHTLSDAVDSEDIKLRFKYFQTVEGELTLPENFDAQKLELVARAGSERESKSYSWLVEDR